MLQIYSNVNSENFMKSDLIKPYLSSFIGGWRGGELQGHNGLSSLPQYFLFLKSTLKSQESFCPGFTSFCLEKVYPFVPLRKGTPPPRIFFLKF